MASLGRRLRRLEGRIRPPDLAAEERWQRAVEVLDAVVRILSHNEGVNTELAKIEEFNPSMSKFAAQLEAKRRVVESDPRGGVGLWEAFTQLKGPPR